MHQNSVFIPEYNLQTNRRCKHGSLLGPVMANIKMTEIENKVIKTLINDGTVKFYCRYVDETLLVVKSQDVSCIHKLLKSFDENLKFTVDLKI